MTRQSKALQVNEPYALVDNAYGRLQAKGKPEGISSQSDCQMLMQCVMTALMAIYLERSLLPTSVKNRAVELKSTSSLFKQYSFTRLTGGID